MAKDRLAIADPQVTISDDIVVRCPLVSYRLVRINHACANCDKCAGLVQVVASERAAPETRFRIRCSGVPLERDLLTLDEGLTLDVEEKNNDRTE